jgi:hypothetical protein
MKTMVRFHAFKAGILGLALVAGAVISSPSALAQNDDANWRLLNEILNTSNSVNNSGSEENARKAYARCVELGEEVRARQDMDITVRHYFEAEVESCLHYAMHRGKFSNGTVDQCSHHFAFAKKLVDAILSAQGKAGPTLEQLENLRHRLRRAGETGPDIGCTGDYAGLIALLPVTDTLPPSQPPGVPDEQILRHITGAIGEIGATETEAWLRTCRSFLEGVSQRAELHEVERIYFGALVENCLATALARSDAPGKYGDACVHHHLYATRMAEALARDKETPFFNADYRLIVSEELKVIVRQGPAMGCLQDYGDLRGD